MDKYNLLLCFVDLIITLVNRNISVSEYSTGMSETKVSFSSLIGNPVIIQYSKLYNLANVPVFKPLWVL